MMLSSQQQQSPYEYDDDDDEILRGKYIIIRVVQDRKVRATDTLRRGKLLTDRFSPETFALFIPVHSL